MDVIKLELPTFILIYSVVRILGCYCIAVNGGQHKEIFAQEIEIWVRQLLYLLAYVCVAIDGLAMQL